METYEVLEKALALIEDESHWCQNDTRIGDAFCAVGALNFAMTGIARGSLEARARAEARGVLETYYEAAALLNGMAEDAGYEPISGRKCAVAMFNNDRSHAEVVALFQKAIRQEKEKAGIPVEIPERELVA